jgi:serine/threonine protein kinase/Leucine-rich repeat (LRR) protein
MTITLEQFISQLDESGVISAVDIAAFQESQSPPAESAEDLGKLLVKQKKVTKLQAQLVYQGKGDRLLLGNYLILDKIGAGGMGDVYLAEHRRMERRVALKTLPATMTRDTQSIQRFHREVKAAAKLSHPNIVAAYDADEANGVHYFVMEHVDGTDLSAVVKKQGVLKVETAIDYILQAAKGLEFAHNKGVIHRDIKPANMLLDNDGTVKILDMGLARIEDEAHEIPATQLTQDGSVMGTVDYMAPEQAKDTHTADARSDIYSLGCSLYYLLTGESVYRGSTMVNRIMAHQNDPIPSLAGKHILISQDVDAVFQKMVAKKPEDRFQSMSEVIVALENCIQMKSSSTVSEEPSDPELQKFLQSQKFASSPTVVMSADAMTAEKPLTDTQNESLTSGFLNNTLGGTSYQPLARRRKSIGKRGGIIAGVVLASLILIAGIVFKIDTPAGTIILDIDQPELAGAVVSVDEQQKITIKTGKGTEPIEVVADETTHTLQVTKGGFETFTKQFTVKAGGKETIKVRLKPLVVAKKKVPSKGTPAKSHYALRFQNDSDHVTLALKHETPGDLTVEAWVTIDEDSILAQNYITNTLNRRGLLLGISGLRGDEMRWVSTIANNDRYPTLETNSKVELGKRTNIAVTYKGNVAQIYVNGHKKGEMNFKGLEIHTDRSFSIGWKDIRNFKGSIDEVRFSNTARYTKDFTPKDRFESDEHTMALYHFDEGSGDILKDSSGNGHDGKIVGAKWVKVDDELQGSMEPLAVAEKKMPPAGTPAKSHYALRFKNDSDHVTLPLKHETAGDLTVEAWVTIDENTLKPQNFIAIKSSLISFFLGNSSIQGKEMQWNTTVMNDGQFYKLKVNSKVEFGKRTNIVVTYKGNVAQIYVNGHKKGEMNFKRSELRNGYLTTIGWKDNLNFKGSIDEVRFSNVARYTEDFTPDNHFKNDEHTMALYHFDEGSGDVLKDSSGNGHHGKIVGAKWVKVDDELQGSMVPLAVAEKKMPSAGTPAKSHSAIRFQNDSDRVVLPLKHETAGDLTVEAWVTIDENSNRPLRFIANGSSLTSFGIGYSKAEGKEKEWSTSVSNNGQFQVLQTDSKVEFGKRTNITVTYKGNVAQIYVNGHKQGEMNFNGSNIHTDEFITIGNRYKGPPIKGSIDEVRFSNIARYSEDFTPTDHFENDKNTLALYHFDEGSGDVLKDSSGNGHDGKIVGAKWVKVDDELQVIQPATTSEKPMTDREVAEWVIGMGGEVRISGKNFTKIEQLPTLPFVIGTVTLADTSVKDDDLKRLAGLKNHVGLNIENTLVSDTGVQYLKDIPLSYINLSRTQITDKGLGYFSNMPSLMHLHASSTTISNSGVEQFKDMKQLVQIFLENTQIDDAGLGHLTGLTNVNALGLYGTAITDSGLKQLKGMKQLRVLSLGNTRITNAGLKELAGLKNLNRLGLNQCKLTDASLEFLKDLKNLQDLTLDFTPITDAGLQHLYGLKKLEDLNLRDTKVTAKGIDKLQKALPNCKIVSDFETTNEPERHMAEWVVSIGGTIRVNNKEGRISRLEDLPKEPFFVSSISFSKNENITDHRLRSLKELKQLEGLYIEATPVTNAGMQHLAQLTSLTELDISFTSVGDEGLQYLARLEKLTYLSIQATKITDAGLKHLTNLRNLTSLNLNVTMTGDQGLEYIKNLINLTVLHGGKLTTDEGLKHLSQMKQLQRISFDATQVTGSGLVHLPDPEKLVNLNLQGSPVTDENLQNVSKCTNLEKLYLRNTKITDAGLKYLESLKQLKNLTLQGTKITDTGLKHLESMKRLESLHLGDTKVTTEGINALTKKLPQCKITYGPEEKPIVIEPTLR